MQRCRRLRDASHQLLAIPACGGSEAVEQFWETLKSPGFQRLSLDPRHLLGEASGAWPRMATSTLCHERRAHFSTEPPHPVPGCVLEVLVLLVTTLHQSGECVVVEVVVVALFLRRPYRETAAAIRAMLLAVFTIVVKDPLANLRRIRSFFMWRSVVLGVGYCTRCDAVTTGCDEA